MANEIRPEDVRRIAAQKEREVLGDSGRRRFVDPRMDFSAQAPLPPSDSLPPLVAETRVRGPYDRAAARPAEPPLELDTEADDDLGLPPSYSPTDYGRAEEYYEEERPRRSRWLPVSVALLALLGFAGVVWYAYDWGSVGGGRGSVPIIQASAGEEKVKPTNEAGMDVPNQESTVLNPQAEEPKEEVLMPPPEEPVVLIEPGPEPEEEAVVILSPAPPAPAAPAPAQAESTQGSGADTIAAIIAAQGSSQSAAAPAASAAPAAPVAPQPPAVTPAAAPAAAPAVALPAPSPATQPVIAAGGFLIQLASLTSVDAAEQTWARLQKQHAMLLGDMAVNIQKAEIDGKGTYFRVQAGPLPNRATADDMCAQLKAAQQDCIVVKR